MNTVIIIVSAVIGLVAGLLFGAFPLRTTQMTRKQESYSSALGFVSLGLVLVLILTGFNTASYVLIFALIIGFGIAKIPVIHQWFVRNFKIFKPKKVGKKK
ncbi:hypothetical protein [Alloscardovia criceti]|uniref:hypothetical protein n=1 Tax=Alloscardovia criceti TaxID=356828 RepID=UPI0003622B25|nr:hypothetical protein [Alloscardovia criceti]